MVAHSVEVAFEALQPTKKDLSPVDRRKGPRSNETKSAHPKNVNQTIRGITKVGDEGLAEYAETWRKQQSINAGAAKSAAAIDVQRLAARLTQHLNREQMLELIVNLQRADKR